MDEWDGRNEARLLKVVGRGTPVMSKAGSILAALLLCLFVPGGLAGCTVASLVGANETPPVTHDLLAQGRRGLGFLPIQLKVNEPSAVDALASERIAIKPDANEISYFASAQWSDKLPRLLQLRLIETIERSRVVRAVSTGGDRLRGDFGLSWDIRDFQVEVNNGSARARVRVYVKLIDEDAGVQVSSSEYTATAMAADDSVNAGVEALTAAFSQVSVKIMRWLVSRRISVVDARSATDKL
jgi:cholesterol transport system auxiliary component